MKNDSTYVSCLDNKSAPFCREIQAKKYGSSLWHNHTHFGVKCKIMRKDCIFCRPKFQQDLVVVYYFCLERSTVALRKQNESILMSSSKVHFFPSNFNFMLALLLLGASGADMADVFQCIIHLPKHFEHEKALARPYLGCSEELEKKGFRGGFILL